MANGKSRSQSGPSLLARSSDKDGRIAYTHLRDAFYNYFSTRLDDARPDILWLDYAFAVKHLEAPKAIKDLKANLLNKAAAKKLEEKLNEAGAFGSSWKEFYFWNTDPHNWSDISIQSRAVDRSFMDTISNMAKLRLPPQHLALGAFSFNAIPEGYVEPKGNGVYEICVNKMYLFVNDTFNFEGNAFLGYWSLKNDGEAFPFFGDTVLGNSDFNNIKRLNYGRDFPVLSRLHEVENFEPKCWRSHHVK